MIRGKLESPGIPSRLFRRPRWLLVGLLVAAAAAASPFASVRLLPPSIHLGSPAHATAQTELAVGIGSALRHNVPDLYVRDFSARADSLADMLASSAVLDYVARSAGVDPSKVAVDAPLWTALPRDEQWATGEKRARQIVAEAATYRITLDDGSESGTPVINVTTQAPSARTAGRLAQAVDVGLNRYLSRAQNAGGTPSAGRYSVAQLDPVTVAPASKTQLENLVVFTFLSVFILWCGLLLAVTRLASDLIALRGGSQVSGPPDRSSGRGADRRPPFGVSSPRMSEP